MDAFLADPSPLALALASAGRTAWAEAAATRLHTSLPMYLAALGVPVLTAEGEAEVVLGGEGVHPLADWIENGLDSFDMRDYLRSWGTVHVTLAKKGGNGRPSVVGRYVNVPFRHAVPGAAGGAARAAAAQSAGSAEPHQISDFGHAYARLMTRIQAKYRQSPGQIAKNMTSAVEGAAQMGRRRVQQPDIELLRPRHTTGPYDSAKLGAKKVGSGGLMTWRRMSVDAAGNPTNADAWMHPGIVAHHFVDAAADAVARVAPFYAAAALGGEL